MTGTGRISSAMSLAAKSYHGARELVRRATRSDSADQQRVRLVGFLVGGNVSNILSHN